VTGSVAVIGDVGGHRDELEGALIDLGWNPETGLLPSGLVVVQLGDLVHRGPDSTGVLDLVERVMDANPTQWVQLVGNHEGHYIGGPQFQPREYQVTRPDRQRLVDWWDTGRMRMAAAIEVEGVGEVLVTHAGLTAGMWAYNGSHSSASAAAMSLNLLSRVAPNLIFTTGAMVQDTPTNRAAGPVWAHPTKEVLASWLELGEMPFHQIHGHATEYRWRDGRWDQDVPASLRTSDAVDFERRHTRLRVGGHVIMGIDPGHGADGALRWAPLLLANARVVEPPLDAPNRDVVQRIIAAAAEEAVGL
jgi:hypothetical protein